MNPTFDRLMSEATRLTRAGNLLAATAAIQSALNGKSEARQPGETDVTGVADVIDVETRELGESRAVADVAASTSHPDPDAGGFIAGTHCHPSAGTREYKLYVPPGYRGQPLPLLLMLHGCTQNPDDFAAGTRMNESARAHDFFVLYPAQTQKANPSRCWNWFKHSHQRRDRGEPALLASMTREVMSRYAIDARRVYVAGLSAGGAMTAILGQAYPDLFAAAGVHSGLPAGSARDLPSALSAMKIGAAGVHGAKMPPTIVFHGDQDPTVHPANGEHVAAASAGDATAEIERAQSLNGRRYTRRSFRDAGGRIVAEHWAVHGSGHAWSGGSPSGSYTDPTGPDATQEMLRFFFSHTL